jgi:UDP-N-acetylglucosamine--N-acetylmuramyl-(pentapeptide) pyrophosphoryl-undecaprenol N-acetylglucosamine transferase
VQAGKFRRYHGEGLKQVLDVKTMGLNMRDAFRVLRGYWQSYKLLKMLQPDCVFIKGGFVGVPVGLAAAQLHIPYITHDSDAIPGLANRIIAKWATLHTVALPKEVYHYPAEKTRTVGVPVHANYQPVDAAAQAAYKHDLKLEQFSQVVLITGGGLGARRLNDAVANIVLKLLTDFPELAIIQSVGRGNETAILERYHKILNQEQQSRVAVQGYMPDLYRFSGAADVIVTRAGATTLAEFAVQHKACVVVPNPILTGGHQLKNAEYLAAQGAIEIVHEGALSYDLYPALSKLLRDTDKQQALQAKLAAFAVPDSARQLAMVLLDEAKKRSEVGSLIK